MMFVREEWKEEEGATLLLLFSFSSVWFSF
jgi:hypothetical protein